MFMLFLQIYQNNGKITKKLFFVLRKFCRESKKMTVFEDFSSYNVIATYKNNTKYGKEKESEESRVTGKEKCR